VGSHLELWSPNYYFEFQQAGTNYVGHFKSSAHYVFSLKMNLFYKIHLQAINVISIVLYHSGPTFGKVLYSCLDAFTVEASDYSGLVG
jgi:hypothetical protein